MERPNREKSIVIMAAGMGSRFGGLKQLAPVGPSGEILMEYAVHDALASGFTRAVFILRKEMEGDFHRLIGSRLASRIEVRYAFQEADDLPSGFTLPPERTKPWGTSHAILSARDTVDTPFAVFNADDFYGRRAFGLMAACLDTLPANGSEAAMAGYRIGNTLSPHGEVTRGLCRTENGWLAGVEEIKKIHRDANGAITCHRGTGTSRLPGTELCSMNFWGFVPALFDILAEEFPRFLAERGTEPAAEWLIPETVDSLIRRGTLGVRVLETEDSWFGVTYPDDAPAVRERIRALTDSGVYPSPLFPEGRP